MESKVYTISYAHSKKQRVILKRLFDCVFSCFVLLLGLPFFLLIGFLIFIFSPGNVIFSQERLGLHGKVFRCYKFRSMHPDAEKKLDEILSSNVSLREEWRQNQKLKNDPRVFFLGRFLRKTSLDEFPQFWNVLKGDLSVVGPRPYMVSQKEDLKGHADKILAVRPGITGIWQTSGRNKRTFAERVLMDADYVDKNSMLFDLGIILKTIPVIFFDKDAY